MSSKDNQIFYIPQSITNTKAISKYKSPQPSPVNLKKNFIPPEFSKENYHKSALPNNSRKNSIASNHKPLDHILTPQENISELGDFIQKYHPALAQQNSQSFKQQIEKMALSNKDLKQSIASIESKISQKVIEKSNKITKSIQKTQNEIDALETHYQSLKKISKVTEYEDVKNLLSENQSLTESNKKIEDLIANYKKAGIKNEEFSVLQIKILDLENIQDSLISKNGQLKKELNSQMISNSSSKANIEMQANKLSLSSIYSQIVKLEKIAKNYLIHEPINLINILQNDDLLTDETIPSAIAVIRKQVANLRMLVSDIYAEDCGDLCQNQ
jgi:hypothetical protein